MAQLPSIPSIGNDLASHTAALNAMRNILVGLEAAGGQAGALQPASEKGAKGGYPALGPDGGVIVVPAPPAPKSLELYAPLISTNDLTGAARAIDLPGDTRFAYIIVRFRRLRSVNTAKDLWVRVNAGAGIDTGATSYSTQRILVTGTTLTGIHILAAEWSLTDTQHVDNTNTGVTGFLEFSEPGESGHAKRVRGSSDFWPTVAALSVHMEYGLEYVGATTPLTQIEFLWSDASNFAEGLCDLYGIPAV